jgi:hypothetical protein
MRYVLSVALLAFAAGASPAHADGLILTLPALAQTDPATLPPGPQPVGPQPVEPLPPPGGEVIRPLELPPPDQPPPPEPGFWESLTGVQWLGIAVAVIGIGALAASGGGGDEPEPAASGGN